MPADHRNRTDRKSEQRLQPKSCGQTDSQQVLHHDQQGADSEKHKNLYASFFEQPEAGGKADRGEEGRHKDILKGGVKFNLKNPADPQTKGEQCKNQSTDDRGRDTKFLKKTDFSADGAADPVKDRRHRNTLIKIQGNRHAHHSFAR